MFAKASAAVRSLTGAYKAAGDGAAPGSGSPTASSTTAAASGGAAAATAPAPAAAGGVTVTVCGVDQDDTPFSLFKAVSTAFTRATAVAGTGGKPSAAVALEAEPFEFRGPAGAVEVRDRGSAATCRSCRTILPMDLWAV